MHFIKRIKAALYFKRLVFVLFLLLSSGLSYARTVRLDFIGTIPTLHGKPTGDTVRYMGLFRKFDWDVTITGNGTTRQFSTSIPDTLFMNARQRIYLATTFVVDPRLVNEITTLHFGLGGSVSVKLNGTEILSTGSFSTNTKSRLHKFIQDDYVDFLFKDTLEKMEVIYIPYANEKILNLDLQFEQAMWGEKRKEEKTTEAYQSFALGFYYFAFGIIFLIFFIFFKERTENLYFSFFCVFAAGSFLCEYLKLNFFDGLAPFLAVFSLEFLSIFFAKVLKNKEKSKIPLLIIGLLTAVSYLPIIRDNYTSLSSNTTPILLMRILLLVILFCYTGISALYYLIQGIGQKRWEARTIVFIIAGAVLLIIVTFLVTGIVSSISGVSNSFYAKSLQYLSGYLLYVCLFVYPLSGAIVLGKRNGLNQKQLIKQIQSIEKLSTENLEKEKEKKLILESQNTELERKVNERTYEVMRQKVEIEVKNKAITDNLIYAQRIQSAILPDIKLIYKALEQSFIIYLPKDIVSGDFYAFAEKNEKVLIIAGDCTGHGVSGAFMSMIGSSLLNQIIGERKIEEPSLILNELNSSVIEALKQSENESHDGMDVSICSFDLKKYKLSYAGANRPLWLIRDGRLQVFSPDKFPIGGLQVAKERTFTNYNIDLQKNDTLYIFTDGYTDQFGGEFGKKLMTAKFKEMLISIQHLDMREQEAYLKDYFEKWKGGNEQVDDVLVIGIRV
jgi:serine phosphatase RsbU (regulator of sigma subunit)